MTKPIIVIHNVETNEIIEREMNDVEFAEYQAQQASEAAIVEPTIAEKLASVGLSIEELKAALA